MNTRLFLTALMVTAAFTAAANPTGTLPDAVQQEVHNDQKICQENGGRFSYADAISKLDLNQDGHLDYVYDASLANCANTTDLGGKGGWPVTVFAGQPDGSAKMVFSHGAHGSVVTDGKLYLGVAGVLCGGNTQDKAHAEYQNCLRPLAWNARKQEFEFAPLAQKRPFPENGLHQSTSTTK